MTKFEAINEIFLSLNELPLEETDSIADIPIAVIVEKELEIAKKKVLARGWNFNEVSQPLSINPSGYIVVPKLFLSVDAGTDIIVRDWKLYDTVNQTFKFTEDVTVTVIEDLEFEDLPYHITDYIIKTASLHAYINIMGYSEDVSIRFKSVDEARIEAIRDDAAKTNGNLLAKDYAVSLLDRTGL